MASAVRGTAEIPMAEPSDTDKEDAMAEETKDLPYVDWRRHFAFFDILRTFRMAVHPGKIALCFLGLALSVGLTCLIDQIPGIGQTNVRIASVNPIEYRLATFGLNLGERTTFYQNAHYVATRTLWGQWAAPYVGDRTFGDSVMFLASPLLAARDAVSLAIAYWQQAPLFALVNTVLWLAIWAVVGGAVTRMAAVRIARDDAVPLVKAVGFSLRKWPSTVTSPLIPFAVFLVLGILLLGLPFGVPLMLPYAGEFVVGLLFGLALVFGLVLTLVFVGGAFSLGLQWPTIAAEGSDSFDAISRSISYITSRPWRYLFYTAFSAVYGCLTFVFVKLVAFLTLRITHEFVSRFCFTWVGTGQFKLVRMWDVPTLSNPWPQMGADTLEQLSGAEASAQYLFHFWVWIVLGMTVAFLVSFYFASQTVIYFLLRKVVDATDTSEVYMEEGDEEALPLESQPPAPEMVKIQEQAVPEKPAPPKPEKPAPPKPEKPASPDKPDEPPKT
jgi:hypothetical protein